MNDQDHDLIIDYILGELDVAARQAVEQRLATDADFARNLAALETTLAEAVLVGTPAVAAPSSLRERVLADVSPATEDEASPGKIVGFPFWTAMGWGAAAALAILAAVLDSRLRQSETRADDLQAEVAVVRGQLEEVSRDLAASAGTREQLQARLAQLESRSRLDSLRIAALNSQLEQAAAFGFAVFDPETDEGVIEVINLPAIDAESQDYQLWVVDPQYPTPVDGGVIQVDEEGHTRVRFSAGQPVNEVTAFAISLERKGGVPVAEGPMVLVGAL